MWKHARKLTRSAELYRVFIVSRKNIAYLARPDGRKLMILRKRLVRVRSENGPLPGPINLVKAAIFRTKFAVDWNNSVL